EAAGARRENLPPVRQALRCSVPEQANFLRPEVLQRLPQRLAAPETGLSGQGGPYERRRNLWIIPLAGPMDLRAAVSKPWAGSSARIFRLAATRRIARHNGC